MFVCSGAADVGEVADRAVRQMSREGLAAMSCVASVGARDSDFMFNTDLADQVLLVDGCPRACTRRTFELAGLHRFKHFDLSEVGLLKGQCPMTGANLQTVIHKAREMLT